MFPHQDILFLANEVWDWQILDELGSTAFYVGQFEEGYNACMQLLKENKFPESERGRIMANLEQYQMKMQEIQEMQKKQIAHTEAMNAEIEEKRQARLATEKEERAEARKKADAKRAKAKKEKQRRAKKKQKA